MTPSAWVIAVCALVGFFAGGAGIIGGALIGAVIGFIVAMVTPWTDYNGTRYGIDTGTLAEPAGPQFLDYTESGPTNWRSGFAVFTIHKGRLLLPELAQVHGNAIEFRGKVIEV